MSFIFIGILRLIILFIVVFKLYCHVFFLHFKRSTCFDSEKHFKLHSYFIKFQSTLLLLLLFIITLLVDTLFGHQSKQLKNWKEKLLTRLGFTLQSTLRCLTIKIQFEVILLFFIFISLSYSSHIILLIFIIVNMLHFQNVIFSLFLEKATSLYFSYSLNLSVLKKTFLLYQIIYCGPSLKIGSLTSISVCTSLISFS